MSAPIDRRDELLADRALGSLSPDEMRELEALLLEHPTDVASFEDASIAMHTALGSPAPLPAALLSRLRSDASVSASRMRSPRERDVVKAVESRAPSGRRARIAAVVGWAVAAALALALGFDRTRPPAIQVVTVTTTVVVPPPPVPPLSFSEQRERLLAEGAGLSRIDWTGTKDAASAGVTGDVVWSPTTQRGFMRFRGLAVNDPARLQYQLWIFDKSQDAKHPIDGGVFDIDRATGDVIVPITPKIQVREATLFAITIEKPGGVVVSSREHLVLLAKAPPG